MAVVSSVKEGVRTIRLNRPKKKNAIDQEMYKTIARILNEDATNDQIVVTILTGTGDYFSSGNDIKASSGDVEESFKRVEEMIEAFINYPKLLICVVNGIAIGIAATIVTVCDIVYASDNAVFDTPFLRLGLCVEGTSSYNFPFILGRSIASEILLLNRKLTAQEACHYGLISKVIPSNELDKFINDLHQYGKLPLKNLKRNKAIIMQNFRKLYSDCNKREFEGLRECVSSEEFVENMMKFLNRKSKL